MHKADYERLRTECKPGHTLLIKHRHKDLVSTLYRVEFFEHGQVHLRKIGEIDHTGHESQATGPALHCSFDGLKRNVVCRIFARNPDKLDAYLANKL